MDTRNQESIHYRVGGKLTHAGVEMLPEGNDIPRIVIERIEYKESEMINGRSEFGVWVAHFAQNPYTTLPLILNATNRKRLIKQFPECDGYPARLKNVAVRLTKERCRDVNDGGETWGLRISKIPADPESAPAKKVITADKVDIVINWARENGKGMSDIASMYDFESDTVRDAIADALNIIDLPE
jgi:hypothetical protein